MIKYDKRLDWLRPFLHSVRDLVPLEKIHTIRGYSVPLDKEEQQYASITQYKKKYNINLRLTMNYYLYNQQKDMFLSTLLETFAHELAHLRHWDHTADHFELTAKLLLRFSFVLKKLKINKLYQRPNYKKMAKEVAKYEKV
jgi:hypothetical protein